MYITRVPAALRRRIEEQARAGSYDLRTTVLILLGEALDRREGVKAA